MRPSSGTGHSHQAGRPHRAVPHRATTVSPGRRRRGASTPVGDDRRRRSGASGTTWRASRPSCQSAGGAHGEGARGRGNGGPRSRPRPTPARARHRRPSASVERHHGRRPAGRCMRRRGRTQTKPQPLPQRMDLRPRQTGATVRAGPGRDQRRGGRGRACLGQHEMAARFGQLLPGRAMLAQEPLQRLRRRGGARAALHGAGGRHVRRPIMGREGDPPGPMEAPHVSRRESGPSASPSSRASDAGGGGLHAGRNFLAEQLDEQFRHGARADTMSVWMKSLPLNRSGASSGLGQSIGHAVAVVQLCRMLAAPAILLEEQNRANSSQLRASNGTTINPFMSFG